MKSLARAEALGFDRFELFPPVEWLELMIVTLLRFEIVETLAVTLLRT